jgi:hypothetical protein
VKLLELLEREPVGQEEQQQGNGQFHHCLLGSV